MGEFEQSKEVVLNQVKFFLTTFLNSQTLVFCMQAMSSLENLKNY